VAHTAELDGTPDAVVLMTKTEPTPAVNASGPALAGNERASTEPAPAVNAPGSAQTSCESVNVEGQGRLEIGLKFVQAEGKPAKPLERLARIFENFGKLGSRSRGGGSVVLP
jgi:hypothetical protein